MVPAERTVTVGVGHGKRAAWEIDAWLRGTSLERPPKHPLGDVRPAQPVVLRRRGSPPAARAGAVRARRGLRGGARRPDGARRNVRGRAGACRVGTAANATAASAPARRTRSSSSARDTGTASTTTAARAAGPASSSVPCTRSRCSRSRGDGSRPVRVTVDGNEAAASVAYRCNEICCIYPITPSSPMAELADEWSSRRRPNLWGTVPSVVEMQSEAGAAGALHGALQGGTLATTFTASQGLLLMIPTCTRSPGSSPGGAARGRAVAGGAGAVDLRRPLRRDGRAPDRLRLLASASVQEAHDMALVAQAATLRTRVPFAPRRVPHLARAEHARAARRRRPAGADPRRAGPRAPRAPSRPSGRSSAAPLRTRTSTSRRARPSTPSTPARPASCRRS